jgi:hypothetical protein
MILTKYIKNSIEFVVDGFACVLRNPILFIYPVIFLTIPAIIAISRYFNIPSTHRPDYAYNLITTFNIDTLISMLLITSFFILLTFVAASISIHIFAILNRKSISVAQTLQKLSHHAEHLALWGVITTVLTYLGLALLHIMHEKLHGFSSSSRALETVHHSTDIIWLFCTFFMLQIHALEECSLLESLKRSFLLSSRLIPHVIAIRLSYLIALYLTLHIGLLGFMRFIEARYILSDHARMLIEGSIESIILMFFFTVYVVMTTKLYQMHVKEIGK